MYRNQAQGQGGANSVHGNDVSDKRCKGCKNPKSCSEPCSAARFIDYTWAALTDEI